MDLKKFLSDNHSSIAAKWTEAIINTYPSEGAKFFGGSANQFANPAGHVFRSNIEDIFRSLVQGASPEDCSTALDGILRIRAVQGLNPSVALSFIPALKEIVFREVSKAFPEEATDTILHDWNLCVDRLTMVGFDLYMNCREILWQQKANQLYSRTHKLLEKANLLRNEEVTG